MLSGQPTHGAYPEDRDLSIRVQVVRQTRRCGQTVIFCQRREQATDHVVERNVVVAWHDQLRRRDLIEKPARRDEFAGSRALREIAADRNQMGRLFVQAG